MTTWARGTRCGLRVAVVALTLLAVSGCGSDQAHAALQAANSNLAACGNSADCYTQYSDALSAVTWPAGQTSTDASTLETQANIIVLGYNLGAQPSLDDFYRDQAALERDVPGS